MHEQHLLPIRHAAHLIGMNQRTLRRRIAAGEVATLTDPRDRRRKLIRLDDLRRYLGEVPMAHTLINARADVRVNHAGSAQTPSTERVKAPRP